MSAKKATKMKDEMTPETAVDGFCRNLKAVAIDWSRLYEENKQLKLENEKLKDLVKTLLMHV